MTSYTRRIMAATGLVAIAIGAPFVLHAQTIETTTNVPFAFTAGRTALPRGEYEVSMLPGQRAAVLLRTLEHGVVLLSQPEGPSNTDNTPRLVFHRYGGKYFLREIRLPGNRGFSLPSTAAEIAAAEQVAGGNAKPDVVVVQTGQ
jgi:hypothetical protein